MDIEDALLVERRGPVPGEPPSLHLALAEQVEVLESESAILRAAQALDDLNTLYAVASGLALIRNLSPWAAEELADVSRQVSCDAPHVVEAYRHWLLDADNGLPRAQLTATAAFTVSMALNPDPSEEPQPWHNWPDESASLR